MPTLELQLANVTAGPVSVSRIPQEDAVKLFIFAVIFFGGIALMWLVMDLEPMATP